VIVSLNDNKHRIQMMRMMENLQGQLHLLPGKLALPLQISRNALLPPNSSRLKRRSSWSL